MRHALIAISLAACGTEGSTPPDDEVDCAAITDDDDFVVGLNKLGDNGFGFTIMAGDPAPPIRGDNTWVVQIEDEAAPLAGASVVVEPFMPAHGHGAGKPVIVTEDTTAIGQYELSPVNLWMPGVWETTIRVTAPVEDEVVFRFCIPE